MTHFDDLSALQQLLYCGLLARDIEVSERLYAATRPQLGFDRMPEIMEILEDVGLLELPEADSSPLTLLSSVRAVANIAINDTLLTGTPAFLQHCDARLLKQGSS